MAQTPKDAYARARFASRIEEAAEDLKSALRRLQDAEEGAPDQAWKATVASFKEQVTHTLEGDGLGTDSGLVDMMIKATNEARR